VWLGHDHAHGGVHGGYSSAAMAGHRQLGTLNAVRSKLTRAIALGAHRVDDAHAR
jgi:hypothetical protein